MPRTIESIEAAHRAATERRKAGRPVWDHTVHIKQYFADADHFTTDLRDKAAAALRRSQWVKDAEAAQDARGWDLVEAVEVIEEAESQEDFNEALDHLYDMADADRVWIG